jgi:FMN phosphatase YigB (HAD superfamily)
MKTGAAAIRAAIIDLDGTMLHTVPDFELALNGMRAGLRPGADHRRRSSNRWSARVRKS